MDDTQGKLKESKINICFIMDITRSLNNSNNFEEVMVGSGHLSVRKFNTKGSIHPGVDNI
jgi:hypothetical protein